MAVIDVSEREEDDLGVVYPASPSELRELPDDDLMVTYRKLTSSRLSGGWVPP